MAIAQAWIARNAAPISFLGFYFVLIVVGNLIYASPQGPAFLSLTGFPTIAISFDTSFTPGYWALLLAPFAVTPIIVWATKRVAGRRISAFSRSLPEFDWSSYIVLCGVLYAVVIVAFLRADAFALSFNQSGGAIDTVEARFLVLSRLSFAEKAMLQSLLTFLSFFAVVKAIRKPKSFWTAAATFHILVMSVLLIALNMKWPVLVFYIGLIAALFMISPKRQFLIALGGGVFLIAVYLLIATQVFRLVDSTPGTSPIETIESLSDNSPEVTVESRSNFSNTTNVDANTAPAPDRLSSTGYTRNLIETALRTAPLLFAHATNRMAVSYPYYYNVFTNEGPICGGIIEQAQTRAHVKCRPSLLIYTRIFKADGFEGRGTAPMAVHVSAYALGGWPLAMAALVGASIVLGMFAAIPITSSATAVAFSIVGVVAGYHFSQLPGEGPIFYDHGFFWAFLLIISYVGLRASYAMICRSRVRKAS